MLAKIKMNCDFERKLREIGKPERLSLELMLPASTRIYTQFHSI